MNLFWASAFKNKIIHSQHQKKYGEYDYVLIFLLKTLFQLTYRNRGYNNDQPIKKCDTNFANN